MIGPFAQKHEAELAIDWANGKKFSGLLLARSENVAPEMTAFTTPNPDG
jgi:hypothetical protein